MKHVRAGPYFMQACDRDNTPSAAWRSTEQSHCTLSLSPGCPITVPLPPPSPFASILFNVTYRYLRLTFVSKDLDGDPVRAVKYVECCNNRRGAGMHRFLTVQVHRSIGHSFAIAAMRVRDFSNRRRSRIISALLGNRTIYPWSLYPCGKSHCGFRSILFYCILTFITLNRLKSKWNLYDKWWLIRV